MGDKTRKCSIRDLPRNVAAEINRFIAPNDNILACYETKIDDREFGNRYYAQVITQDRLVAYRNDGTENLRSKRLAEFNEEQAVESGGGSWYDVWNCIFVTKQSAREFSDILRQAIRQAKTMPQQTNLLNELERLAALYRSGALNDVEFQNAKRKLGI